MAKRSGTLLEPRSCRPYKASWEVSTNKYMESLAILGIKVVQFRGQREPGTHVEGEIDPDRKDR